MSELRKRRDVDRDAPTARLEAPRPTPRPVTETLEVMKKIHGEWRDTVVRRNPDTGAEEVVEDSDWNNNLIVVGMTKLLAGLLANEVTFLGGILQHAQGRGNPAWDVQLPTPQFNADSLTDEYFRKPPDSVVFLKDDGSPADPGEVTSRILITTTIDFDEANDEFIREQGLYGGTATGALGSGLLANLIFHKARYKDDSVKIIRRIQLIL